MKALNLLALIIVLGLYVSPSCFSQGVINQYDNNPVGDPALFGATTDYNGEFQIFLDQLYLTQQGGLNLNQDDFSYEMNLVSFPFQPLSTFPDDERKMVLTDPSSLQTWDDCNTYGWANNNSSTHPISMHVEGDFFSNDGYIISHPVSLTSYIYHNTGWTSSCEDTERQFLPHSVIKKSIYLKCGNDKPLEFAYVTDLTRGMLRGYPYRGNNNNTVDERAYDIMTRPVIAFFPLTGQSYFETSNDWYTNPNMDGSGSLNYFPPTSYDGAACGLPFQPEDNDDPWFNEFPGMVAYPAPYTLLNAPVLNERGRTYAGYYHTVSDGVLPLSEYDVQFEPQYGPIFHEYYLDRPFDLTVINSSEKVIYNPSEARIENPMDPADNFTFVFPSGYTFKTAYGQYPSRATYEEMYELGLWESIYDCPVETDLEWSKYIVSSGCTLIIEDCVSLYDVHIYYEPGATIQYNSSTVVGRYTVEPLPDTTPNGDEVVDLNAPQTNVCDVLCQNPEYYDALKIEVQEGEILYLDFTYPGAEDGILSIASGITVHSGGQLNIVGGLTVEFGADAQLLIHDGGECYVLGARLTSACERFWRGIEVWGKNIPNALSEAGTVAITSGSIIENAQIGVFAGKYVYDYCLDDDYEAGVVISQGNIVEDVLFQNCGVGIALLQADISTQGQQSIIEHTKFFCNGLGDPRYNLNNEGAYTSSLQYPVWEPKSNGVNWSNYGVLAWNHDNIQINDNVFFRVMRGISQFDSRNPVNGCEFKFVNNGIQMLDCPGFGFIDIANNQFNYVLNYWPTLGNFNSDYYLYAKVGSAAIQMENTNATRIKNNNFGILASTQDDNYLGIYLENSVSNFIGANTFLAVENGIVVLNSKYVGSGANLIGPEDENQDRNSFQNCKHGVITAKDNTGLIMRCNTYDNGLPMDFETVWANVGVLGNQGEFTDDIDQDQLPAGNLFLTINEKFLDADLQSPEALPTGYSYVHHFINGDPLSDLYPTGSLSVFEQEAAPTYNSETSCASVLQFKPDDEEVEFVSFHDYDPKLISLQQEYDDLEESIDGFNANTQALLDAIYGGISDEQELRDFLQENSPLSNQVLEAYMDRYGVPAEYFRDVVLMNSVVDRELHALLGQRIEDLPNAIADEISNVLIENPDYETLAETQARIDVYTSKRNILFAQHIHGLMDVGNTSLALNDLTAENTNYANQLLFQYYIKEEDWVNAQISLDAFNTAADELVKWRDVAQMLLTAEVEHKWPCLITEEDKASLWSIFDSSEPGDASYSLSKSLLRSVDNADFNMLVPELIPVAGTRSIEYESLVQLVKVYPNPANDYVLIDAKMEKDHVGQIFLYSTTGALVLNQSFNSHFGPGLVEIQELATGSYVYEIRLFDTLVASGNLLVK